jgi:hypothetical protein
MYLFRKKFYFAELCWGDFYYDQIRRTAFSEDGSYFVTVGNRHVKFWYLISTASVGNWFQTFKSIEISIEK